MCLCSVEAKGFLSHDGIIIDDKDLPSTEGRCATIKSDGSLDHLVVTCTVLKAPAKQGFILAVLKF